MGLTKFGLGIATVAGIFTGISTVAAQSQPIAVVNKDNPLTWTVVDPMMGNATPLGSIGVLGDHLLFGTWDEAGTQPGVTHLDATTKKIQWKILSRSGESIVREFGQAGDTVLSTADFDRSGSGDGIVVRTEGRKLHWYVSHDLLRANQSAQAAGSEFFLGAKGEYPFFINPDGKGDRAAALVVGKKNSTVRLYDPRTGARKAIRGLVRINTSKGAVRPAKIRQANGKELVLVTQQSAKTTTLTVINLSTRRAFHKTIPAVGDAIIGDFLASPGEEVAVAAGSSIIILNPFKAKLAAVANPGGVLVDSVNINVMADTSTPAPVPQPTPGSQPRPTAVPTSVPAPPSGEVPSGGLAQVCASTSAIGAGEMLIKSEASNHIGNQDPRTTGYTLVCGRICPLGLNYVPFYYANGELAGAVAYYGRFSGNGQPRLYGAVGRAPQHNATAIARKAATIGNGKLYMQMSGQTSGPGTSCKEFNPSGRNGSV